MKPPDTATPPRVETIVNGFDATSTLMVGRYGVYLTVDFKDQGKLFLSIDDRGSWTMDTAAMVDTADGLKGRLEKFQNQVKTELQHVLEERARKIK